MGEGSEFHVMGHRIRFPYPKPYPTQKIFMNKVLMALTKGENALLESPTGSGKSLSLLCSALAWQEKHPTKRVIFTSRTHTQLKQLVKELRTTSYTPKTVVLGSRAQYCINASLDSSRNKNEDCQALCKDNRCEYRNNSKRLSSKAGLTSLPNGERPIWDIEDLVQQGHELTACPYYASRDISTEQASLILAPYNYLLDPVVRSAMGIAVSNSVVIIDEAHNTEDTCRDAASMEFGLEDLGAVVNELKDMAKHLPGGTAVLQLAGELYEWLKTNSDTGLVQLQYEMDGRILRNREILDFWGALGVCEDSHRDIIKLVDELIMLKDPHSDEPVLSQFAMSTLGNLTVLLGYMFGAGLKSLYAYRVVVLKTPKARGSSDAWVTRLAFWCLDPSLAFTDLERQAYAVVLTSGTLSPLDPFQGELGVSFPHRMEGPHVVDPAQLFVRTVSCGPRGTTLTANYRHTETPAFQDELGLLLQSTVDALAAGGVLVFLPSYHLMEKLQRRWQTTGRWRDLSRDGARLFMEPRSGDDFKSVMAGYTALLAREGTKAVFFAICRGKISEGVDFADQYARVVLSVGIPYPHAKDPQVMLKKEYNDIQARTTGAAGVVSGAAWYGLQAFRALNQALGRCVRHRADYGAILIVDDRFRQARNLRGVSRWIQAQVQRGPGPVDTSAKFTEMTHDLREFFSYHQQHSIAHVAPSTVPSSTTKAPKPKPEKKSWGLTANPEKPKRGRLQTKKELQLSKQSSMMSNFFTPSSQDKPEVEMEVEPLPEFKDYVVPGASSSSSAPVLACKCGAVLISTLDRAVKSTTVSLPALREKVPSPMAQYDVFATEYTDIAPGALVGPKAELIDSHTAHWSDTDRRCYLPLHCSVGLLLYIRLLTRGDRNAPS